MKISTSGCNSVITKFFFFLQGFFYIQSLEVQNTELEFFFLGCYSFNKQNAAITVWHKEY